MEKPVLGLCGILSLILIGSVGIASAEEFNPQIIYQPTIDAATLFVQQIAEAAPKIIAAGIMLLLGFIVGKTIGNITEKITRQVLKKYYIDEKDITDKETKTSKIDVEMDSLSALKTTTLISTTIKWFVYIFFIIAAINMLEFTQLSTALTELWLWIPNILAFILILVVGFIMVKILDKWLNREIKDEINGSKYIKLTIKFVLYIVILSIGLTQLGIGEQIIPILISAFSYSIAIGIGVALAVGLGFALKDIIPTIISGNSKKKSFLQVGKNITVGKYSGKIVTVELFHIAIADDKNKKTTIIPIKYIDAQDAIQVENASDDVNGDKTDPKKTERFK